MKVLLIILGVLLLIGLIPVSVIFRYHGEIELKLGIAFLRLKILPKKAPNPKQEKKKAEKKAKKEALKAEKKKKQKAESLIAKPPAPAKPKTPLPDRIRGLLPWAKLAASFAGEFFHRKLCIKRLRIRAALAGGDPAKLAMTNGKAWEAIGIAVPVLEQAFRIKKRQIAVYPDFLAEKTDLEAEICVRLFVGGVVCLVFKYAIKALRIYLRSRKAKKASGQKKDEAESPSDPESETTDQKIIAKAV